MKFFRFTVITIAWDILICFKTDSICLCTMTSASSLLPLSASFTPCTHFRKLL